MARRSSHSYSASRALTRNLSKSRRNSWSIHKGKLCKSSSITQSWKRIQTEWTTFWEILTYTKTRSKNQPLLGREGHHRNRETKLWWCQTPSRICLREALEKLLLLPLFWRWNKSYPFKKHRWSTKSYRFRWASVISKKTYSSCRCISKSVVSFSKTNMTSQRNLCAFSKPSQKHLSRWIGRFWPSGCLPAMKTRFVSASICSNPLVNHIGVWCRPRTPFVPLLPSPLLQW